MMMTMTVLQWNQESQKHLLVTQHHVFLAYSIDCSYENHKYIV